MSEGRPSDPELVRELRFLGIAEESWPVLAMLPLIQVAWADGAIQAAERQLILHAARETFRVDEEGERLLDSWLSHAPTEHYLERGRDALQLLARRFPELARIESVLELSQGVAKAAGGLFGFRAVDVREAAALKRITETLHVPEARTYDWGDVLMPDVAEEEDPSETAATVVPALSRDEADPSRDDVLEMGEADFSEDDPDSPTITVTFQATAGPRADDGARLVRVDVDPPTPLPLPAGGLTIGRSRACDLWIQSDAKISRHHARLYCAESDPREGARSGGSTWRIQDNASTTGTWVNDERVVDRRLFGGEVVRVGDVEMRFELAR